LVSGFSRFMNVLSGQNHTPVSPKVREMNFLLSLIFWIRDFLVKVLSLERVVNRHHHNLIPQQLGTSLFVQLESANFHPSPLVPNLQNFLNIPQLSTQLSQSQTKTKLTGCASQKCGCAEEKIEKDPSSEKEEQNKGNEADSSPNVEE